MILHIPISRDNENEKVENVTPCLLALILLDFLPFFGRAENLNDDRYFSQNETILDSFQNSKLVVDKSI